MSETRTTVQARFAPDLMTDVEKLFDALEVAIGRLPFSGNDQRGYALQALEGVRHGVRTVELFATPPVDEVALDAAPSLDEPGNATTTGEPA